MMESSSKISSICLKKESNTMMRIGCPMTSWTPPLEWCYKGISHIVVKYSGPISDPIDGGTIYFEPYYNHHIWFDKKKYGEWGILYSKVYIITRIKNANIEDVRDYGISGEDGSIFFQYVEKVVDDNM